MLHEIKFYYYNFLQIVVMLIINYSYIIYN